MSTQYESRQLSWVVGPVGEPIFSEMSTTIRIEDEAAGEFVIVKQSARNTAEIVIDRAEWPAMRDAIDNAISQCRMTP